MSIHSKDVLARLHSHPLFQKAMKDVSPEERAHIEKIVGSFIDQLAGSLTTVASKPGVVSAITDVANGKTPVSGSAG